jgi:hypothetical protein
MKNTLMVLAVLVFAGAGCTTTNFNPNKDLDANGVKKVTAAAPRPPIVYPDQVNAGNAHDKALALGAEMDFDLQSDLTRASAVGAH